MALRSVEAHRRDLATVKLASKIALQGGAINRRVFVSRWTPYCDDPQLVHRAVRPGGELPGLEVNMKVPCRRCAKCLQFRQMKWRERALSEVRRAKRTWFVTLTFSPMHLAGIIQESYAFTRLSPEKAVDRAAFGHVQKYFKRLRKDGHRFRYLAVYERGEKTGRSHYHLFVHEYDRPIGKRVLQERWRSLVHARLVDEFDGSAAYLTKYTTKSFDIAARASQRYGKVCAEETVRQEVTFPKGKENLDAQAQNLFSGLGTSLKIGDMNVDPCCDIQNNAPAPLFSAPASSSPDGASPRETCDRGEADNASPLPPGSLRFIRCTRADHCRSLGSRRGGPSGLEEIREHQDSSHARAADAEPERVD